jgi:hypothetical protein
MGQGDPPAILAGGQVRPRPWMGIMALYCSVCKKIQPEASNTTGIIPHSPFYEGTSFGLYIHLKTACSVCGQFLRYRSAHPVYGQALPAQLVTFLQTHKTSDLVPVYSSPTIAKVTVSNKPYHKVVLTSSFSYTGSALGSVPFTVQIPIDSVDVIK